MSLTLGEKNSQGEIMEISQINLLTEIGRTQKTTRKDSNLPALKSLMKTVSNPGAVLEMGSALDKGQM